jgi:hypothetical protein
VNVNEWYGNKHVSALLNISHISIEDQNFGINRFFFRYFRNPYQRGPFIEGLQYRVRSVGGERVELASSVFLHNASAHRQSTRCYSAKHSNTRTHHLLGKLKSDVAGCLFLWWIFGRLHYVIHAFHILIIITPTNLCWSDWSQSQNKVFGVSELYKDNRKSGYILHFLNDSHV